MCVPGQDDPATTQVHNDCQSHAPVTVEKWASWQTLIPVGVTREVHVLEEAGRVVAYGYVEENHWSEAERQWTVGARSLRDDRALARLSQLFDLMIDKACAHGARELMADGRTDRPEEIAMMRARGFVERMRFPQSLLRLSEFDAAPFADKLARVREAGIEIMPYRDAMARWPEDWKRRSWALGEEVKHDIPWDDGFKPEPFEEYERWVDNPHVWTPDGRFLAVRGDEWVGLSVIERNHVRPEIGNTGLTAVRRPFRRLGLATALKVTALAWAKEQGMTDIDTNNEEKNPMFQLNIALGFRDVWHWVMLKKSV